MTTKPEMLPFLEQRGCPKCGGKDIHSRYCGPGQRDRCCPIFWPNDHAEHIRRHCRRCSYEWDERPLNGTAPTPESEAT